MTNLDEVTTLGELRLPLTKLRCRLHDWGVQVEQGSMHVKYLSKVASQATSSRCLCCYPCYLILVHAMMMMNYIIGRYRVWQKVEAYVYGSVLSS